jgi:hypothetical protein
MRATSLLRDIPFDRLRPKDKPTRYFVDNEYVDGWYVAKLPRLCGAVLDVLLRHCNTETQGAFPSIKRIKKLTGENNPTSISKAIQILEDHGIIIVQRSQQGFGRSNLYAFQSSIYWKPLDEHSKRIKLSTWKGRYQKGRNHDIKPNDNSGKSSEIDTLTNLNNNSPKDLTNQIRSLADQMRINKKPQRVAIPRGSGNTWVPPWHRPDNKGNLGQNRDNNAPVSTGEMQDRSSINIDIIEPEITGKKRQTDDINSDTIQPFKNGEKMDELDGIERKRAEESENSIYLPNIRDEDISAGTSGNIRVNTSLLLIKYWKYFQH